MVNIFRELTEDERKEMVELTRHDYQKEFQIRIAEQEKKATLENRPFCRKCAFDDFRIESEKYKEELRRQNLAAGEMIVEVMKFTKNYNFDKYNKHDYFDLLSEQKIFEKSVSITDAGTTKAIESLTGYYLNYHCKPYKHRISVQVSIEKYNNMNKKK